MNATFCYKQLKTGSVRFPRIDFEVRCAPQKVIPTPTDVYVTNIGALPVRLFFTFNYAMRETDYFNFLVSNLTNRTSVTMRYQPAPIYNIGGLIVDNQYTIAVQAVIDGIPRTFSVATEPFSPGYGILQFTKRTAYVTQIDSIAIPSRIVGKPPVGYIAQRPASAICIDRQDNLILVFADGAGSGAFVLKYTNTGTLIFLTPIRVPENFTPYAVTTDSNSNIYVAGYETRDVSAQRVISPVVVKLSSVDGTSMLSASNYELSGGAFTGIVLTADTIFMCGFIVSTIGVVQSFIISMTLDFQELGLDIRPTELDPDTGDRSVARAICLDSLGRPFVVGYTQTSDEVTTSYFMSIYEPIELQRLLYFTRGAVKQETIGESVALCPDGSVVICGSTSGQLDRIGFIGTGGQNAFTSKYDFSTYTDQELLDNGTTTLPLKWTKLLGSSEPGSSTRALSTAVDALGGIYILGGTTGAISRLDQIGGIEDLFVVKFTSAGKQKYTNQNGSTNFLPFLSTTFANSVAINSNNDFFMAGVSDGIRYDQLTNSAGAEAPGIFVSKYSATL
jgi:hypothetical protein